VVDESRRRGWRRSGVLLDPSTVRVASAAVRRAGDWRPLRRRAQVYLKLHPRSVRTLILVGASALEVRFFDL
jgi:hypothetical protein